MFAHFTEHFTGAEHSLADDITIENYRHYSSIARLLRNKGSWGNDSKIQNDTVLQYDMIRDIAHMTSASCTEISRFLHLPLGRVQDVTGRRF